MNEKDKNEYWGWVSQCLVRFSDYTQEEAELATNELRIKLEATSEGFEDNFHELMYHEEALYYAERLAKNIKRPFVADLEVYFTEILCLK